MVSLNLSPLTGLLARQIQGSREDLVSFMEIDVSSYRRTFMFLKAQRTVLESIKRSVSQMRERNRDPAIALAERLTNGLLEARFQAMFGLATNCIQSLQVYLAKELAPGAAKVCQCLLSVAIAISRVFTVISNTIPCAEDDDAPVRREHLSYDDVDDVLVLCRICEEYVPLSLMEQHSDRCVEAFESGARVVTLDEKIVKLQTAIRDGILKREWPGERDACISTYLPMFHTLMLLDKVLTATTSTSEGACLIRRVSVALRKIDVGSIMGLELLARAIEYTSDKERAIESFSVAADQVYMTRVSSADPVAKMVSIADFDFIKLISSGAFARVFLGSKRKTGDIYAIKAIPKANLQQKNEMQRLITEKDILMHGQNPYIVNFYYSINGTHNLYLVMEFLPGGDLYSLLQSVGSLDEESAKTYVCQIVRALQYLHETGVVHRDIKPDNLLVGASGKVKLTDFGLSICGAADRAIGGRYDVSANESGVTGTPDYIPPEVIMSQSHTFTADYWSLGAVIYEFVIGNPPFHRDTEAETFAAIIAGKIDWSGFDEFSPELRVFVERLLDPSPTTRLGANGADEILQHPWFSDVDWSDLDSRSPPFIPDVSDAMSTEYFEQRYAWREVDDGDILQDIRSVSETETPADSPFMSDFPAVDLRRLVQFNNNVALRMREQQDDAKKADS